jgi:succinate dehydrogenase / fumarate reductase iron-sulfur subunit/fumarate reductase iron-sulfur subunit
VGRVTEPVTPEAPVGTQPLPPIPSPPSASAGVLPPVRVTIARSDPGATRTFDVERGRPTIVLDLLVAIQRQLDPSLAFRYSCRVATCGTCTVRVDGLPVLACQAIVSERARELRIEPLAGLPVVRDLVVDPRPFFERWERIEPFAGGTAATPQEPAIVPPASEERRAIDPTLDCISCGACFSACGVAGDGRRFLGPAALNRAMTLVGDSRDGASIGHAEAAFGPGGIDDCHSIGACTAVCPKGLDPAGAIRRLRRWRVAGHA